MESQQTSDRQAKSLCNRFKVEPILSNPFARPPGDLLLQKLRCLPANSQGQQWLELLQVGCCCLVLHIPPMALLYTGQRQDGTTALVCSCRIAYCAIKMLLQQSTVRMQCCWLPTNDTLGIWDADCAQVNLSFCPMKVIIKGQY